VVGRNYYLLAFGNKLVKGMEKFLLNGFFVFNKLYIVYNKYVRVAVILS